MRTLISNLIEDESGVTAIEYGMIAALITIGIIAVITTIGTELQVQFQSVASGF